MMGKRNVSVLMCAMGLLSACTAPDKPVAEKLHPDTLAVITERDLFPEGTAYDPHFNRVFISSLYKEKITAVEDDGSQFSFIATDSLWSTLGMEADVKANLLWVISAKGPAIITKRAIDNKQWHARLHAFDLTTGQLTHSYDVDKAHSGDFAFNDLTVSEAGDVYLTESLNAKIYVLRKDSRVIEEFLSLNEVSFPNGLALTPDQQYLFVSGSQGLLRITLATKEYTLLSPGLTSQPAPIDGLAFYKNSLIAHQSTQLTRFYLAESLDSIVRHEVLDTGLNSSTTGELGKNGWYYYIANAQLRTGIDYKSRRIRSRDSLQDVVIKKIRLSH